MLTLFERRFSCWMFGVEPGREALFPKLSEGSYFIIKVTDCGSAEVRLD